MGQFDPVEAIQQALGTLKPPPPADAVYNTSRSGLPVLLSGASVGQRGDSHAGMPHLRVKINGTVDEHDADQLSAFFKELAKSLRGVSQK